MKNAGPYARLKFAMDYWCSLWFWPIDKADLLPKRSEFFFDMSLILEGTMQAVDNKTNVQLSLFPTEIEELASEIVGTYGSDSVVDIPKLRAENERLDLAYRIAESNHFMHWELEFADLFEGKGGFDLIIGNPPWIKMTWNEQSVLADKHPMFAVKRLTAAETTHFRSNALDNIETRRLYYDEYLSMSGTQNFLNAVQNYLELKGQQTNLFKCFLPQAWTFCNREGISAYVHPDGVFDDPNGGVLREQLYLKMRRHFQFTNELKLFEEVDHHMGFSLNVYCNTHSPSFDAIYNLFAASTVDDSYSDQGGTDVPGIKTSEGKWNIKGHIKRIIRISKEELSIFSSIFDSNDNWRQARLPIIHSSDFIDVLKCFEEQNNNIGLLGDKVASTEMWHEVNDQNNGVIVRNVHFPDSTSETILSGPHIGVANPLFKASRKVCRLNSDFDSIDLTFVDADYIQRCNYSVSCDTDSYKKRIADTPWGNKFTEQFMVCSRKMLNLSGERTLITAVLPPNMAFINGIFGMAFTNNTALIAGSMASIPYDFYLRITGKSNGRLDTFAAFPVLSDEPEAKSIKIRSLMMNCLTNNYKSLWEREYDDGFRNEDCNIYKIQFPVLQSYEADTWYDANGRIVFTNNRSLTNVGFARQEWENGIKGAPAGQKFYRTITDDTTPGGPVERTIEYVAPFDRCDREQDYETAWKYFKEIYGD